MLSAIEFANETPQPTPGTASRFQSSPTRYGSHIMSFLKHVLILVSGITLATNWSALAHINGPQVDWACTNMHFWSAGSFFHAFQFDEWQDAQGQPCERTNAVRQPTYTVAELYFGGGRSYRFRVRMPVWQIGVCILLIVLVMATLLRVTRRRIRLGERNENHAV
jgi:hypothetical protein